MMDPSSSSAAALAVGDGDGGGGGPAAAVSSAVATVAGLRRRGGRVHAACLVRGRVLHRDLRPRHLHPQPPHRLPLASGRPPRSPRCSARGGPHSPPAHLTSSALSSVTSRVQILVHGVCALVWLIEAGDMDKGPMMNVVFDTGDGDLVVLAFNAVGD
uniref:Uncharacterized protein n=1 Tax=Oryza meridionalis TaxID=40149 RepID=A0A0E0DWH0_9ORYZ